MAKLNKLMKQFEVYNGDTSEMIIAQEYVIEGDVLTFITSGINVCSFFVWSKVAIRDIHD
jgi:hypothetical protein